MSEDTISRQAAIDKFEPWLKVHGYSEGELNMLKAVLYELRFLPSAQPEITEDDVKEFCRKRCLIVVTSDLYDEMIRRWASAERRGRWKPFDLTWGRSIYTCTACGDAFEVPTECGKPMYKFCPYCGASMMDEVEE